jgi:hypothetical protein
MVTKPSAVDDPLLTVLETPKITQLLYVYKGDPLPIYKKEINFHVIPRSFIVFKIVKLLIHSPHFGQACMYKLGIINEEVGLVGLR